MIKSLGIERLLQRRYEKLMSGTAEITHDMSGRINLTVLLTGRVIQPLLRIEALVAGERDIRQAEEIVADLLHNLTAFEIDKHQKVAFELAEELGIGDFIAQHANGLSLKLAARTASSLPASIHDGVVLISGLVKSPDVILFDEANAGLDRKFDLNMIEILRKRIPDCIIVMVTHRPSYIAIANRHISIEQGQLIEADPTVALKDIAV